MTAILIGLVILIVFIIIAVRAGISKEETLPDAPRERVIHMSGIYSIIRNSPREDLLRLRPSEEILRQYLADQNVDMYNVSLGDSDKSALLEHWKMQMDINLREIENGDKTDVVFYYYDFPQACPACAPFVTRGHFVSREEVYCNPRIIPPFHLGCTCTLVAHHGGADLRDTNITGLTPFFTGETAPSLPEWTSVISLPKTSEVTSDNI
ncbi:MAG: hypothetical protein LBI42_13380 [Chitinispirillales bacterium]|jgi:hypothetical protein|nr:hypothetical protein [Chitinispirillales bacterium]